MGRRLGRVRTGAHIHPEMGPQSLALRSHHPAQVPDGAEAVDRALPQSPLDQQLSQKEPSIKTASK